MNQTTVKERYGEQVAGYRELLLNSLLKSETLVLPLKEIKNLFDGYIHPDEVEKDSTFVKFLQRLLPAAKVRLTNRKKGKYIILTRASQEDIQLALRTEKPTKYGKDKVACISCGKKFDYFQKEQGSCETRYRLRGELDREGNVKEIETRDEEKPPLPDSLVLCPSCLQKNKVQIGNKLYCRTGSIPKEAVRKKKSREPIKQMSAEDVASFFKELKKIKEKK